MQITGRPSSPARTPDVGSGLIVACSLLLAATVVVGRNVEPVAAMLILLSAVVAWHRWILSWQVLICVVIASVVFVPVKRYALAVSLPFGLEFYRLTVAMVLLVWVASLLVDPRVRLRRTPFDGPVALIVAAALCSVAVNFGRVAPLAWAVLKNFTLFLSFIIFFYFIASIVTTVSAVVAVTKFIVSGAAVVAASAVVEQRTAFNVFDHVRAVLPFLQFEAFGELHVRYGLIRATGSADHPIALGAFLAMCLPLGFALARSRSILWSVPTVVTLMGIMATASRTPILAVAAATVVFLWLRPRDIRPLLPLVIPIAIVIKVVAPGSIGTVKSLFLPEGGTKSLVAEQSTLAADPTLLSGRANFWPKLVDGLQRPILGQGLGTRQTGEDNPLRNAPILDNQWLGTVPRCRPGRTLRVGSGSSSGALAGLVVLPERGVAPKAYSRLRSRRPS